VGADGVDLEAALAYYRQGAANGEMEGAFRAGELLYTGQASIHRGSTEEDFEEAFRLFAAAAKAGHKTAHFYWGSMTEYGVGSIGADFAKSFEIYRTCCEQFADPDCCYAQGLQVAYGRGTPQDLRDATLLFSRAHEGPNGPHAPSAYYLGTMHANGQGVPVNYEVARVYLEQAAQAGDIRVSREASAAFAELDRAMGIAEAMNKATLGDLERRMQDGDPYRSDNEKGRGGSGSGRRQAEKEREAEKAATTRETEFEAFLRAQEEERRRLSEIELGRLVTNAGRSSAGAGHTKGEL
jgi:hypothetical protein